MSGGAAADRRSPLERILDGPERALLWLRWPPTPRIIIKGTLGFLRQMLRSRSLGLGLRRG